MFHSTCYVWPLSSSSSSSIEDSHVCACVPFMNPPPQRTCAVMSYTRDRTERRLCRFIFMLCVMRITSTKFWVVCAAHKCAIIRIKIIMILPNCSDGSEMRRPPCNKRTDGKLTYVSFRNTRLERTKENRGQHMMCKHVFVFYFRYTTFFVVALSLGLGETPSISAAQRKRIQSIFCVICMMTAPSHPGPREYTKKYTI